MGDKSDLINDNEYRYEFDENILSLYKQLSKEKRNTKSECASDVNISPFDELKLDELSDNERFVLKSLAFLGGITVEKKYSIRGWAANTQTPSVALLKRD